jgi:[ribosomal protein S5]-alanine N-acetyltransferase
MKNFILDNQQSERILFRRVTQEDFNSWLEFFKDPRSLQYLALPKLEPEALCQFWIDLILERYAKNRGGMNALIEKATGAFLGQCGLLFQDIDGKTEIEIGYSIIPKYWGKGYATEAAIKCKEYAFENNLTDSIISIILQGNKNSVNVALKNGMKYDKTTVYKERTADIYRINRALL